MAKPATRQQLIDYCLRKLGAPVLEINVDDDQIDDLVDDALQLFNERHFDGVERMYLKYKITQDDINRGKAGAAGGVGIVTTTGTSTIVGTATTFSFYENSNYQCIKVRCFRAQSLSYILLNCFFPQIELDLLRG